jgi:hypothetical protein
MPKSRIAFLNLPDDLRKKAEKFAVEEDRSLAGMLRLLIKEAIQARETRQN